MPREVIHLPEVRIIGDHHWKVGDNIDINGGETIHQMALVFCDDTHFEVRFYNEAGQNIFTTPGVVDKKSIEERAGTLPKYADYAENQVPLSKRKR